jgi:hypothetical protein
VLLASLTIGHNALGGRDNGYAETLHDLGHISYVAVDTQTGL